MDSLILKSERKCVISFSMSASDSFCKVFLDQGKYENNRPIASVLMYDDCSKMLLLPFTFCQGSQVGPAAALVVEAQISASIHPGHSFFP